MFVKIIKVCIFFFSIILIATPIFLIGGMSFEFALLIGAILIGLIDLLTNIQETVLYHPPLIQILMRQLNETEKNILKTLENEDPMTLKELAHRLKKTQNEIFEATENLIFKGILTTEHEFEKERTILKYKIR